MVFSEQQIKDILRIIDFQHSLFIGYNLGTDVLQEDDKNLLRQFGINPEELRYDNEFTKYDQSFYWGRLSAALRDQAGKVDYNDFLQYLRRGQYISLTRQEQNALNFVKRSSYGHIKNLGTKIRQDVDRIIIEEDAKKRKDYEDLIQGSIQHAIETRRSVKDIVLEIGNKTKDWGRDLGRIAETELQTAFETGRLEQILGEHGEDAMCYRDVFPGACRHCISLYLTAGIGSQPKLFKVKDILANGTNINVKTSEWVPVAGSTHPFCRCLWNFYDSDTMWNEEKKIFIEKPVERKIERKSKAYIKVGDKEYWV